MSEAYPLGLCLLDLVPNLAFLLGAYFLLRLVLLSRNPFGVVSMIVGSALVFLGGTLKALWKLLCVLGLGDLTLLSELQFVLLAPGFLAMLLSVLVLSRSAKDWRGASLAGMASWKIPFLATMTLCSLGLQGLLTYLSFRRRARLAAALYILSILCMLGLAGLAGGEQTLSRQWVEESVNSLGQLAFAGGSWRLYVRSRQGEVQSVPAARTVG
ncbi:MAG: hypothetical protein JXA37_11290 [Chloroflexia bacterium]|nr:hypothetical protein [Chloroflexia bacterium]